MILFRNIVGAALIAAGVFFLALAVLGTFRFRYVLNRMQAASLCDTLGLLFSLLGVIVLLGVCWQSAKVLLILLFVWTVSPVMSHLIAHAEIATYAHIQDECEVKTDDDDGRI